MSKIYINTDGGSRGNPGPAGIGVVFFDDKEKVLHKAKKFIDTATNNEAEYTAIIFALELLSKSDWIKSNKREKKVVCRLDSQLVVEQLNGNYRVKQPHIGRLVETVRKHILELGVDISFVHVPREENKAADKLVNEALDEATK